MSVPAIVPSGVFPFGVHVYREPWPSVQEVIDDLPRLKADGFTMIKIQQHWGTDEPREGELEIDHILAMVSAAEAAGLGVYIGFTLEQMPQWVWRKHPDAFLVDATGQPHNDPTLYTLSTDGKPGPCWHHEGVRADAASFIERFVAAVGAHQNVWVWNTWQEIGFWHNEAGTLGFCYCPRSLTAFRDWLRERYGDLAGLNAAWRVNLGVWDEVEPPRRYTASPAFLDWRFFMNDVYITDALTFKTEAIRAADALGRPVFSHVGGLEPGSSVTWRWSKPGDFFGASAYPAWHPFERWDDDAVGEPLEHATKATELWGRQLLETDILRSSVRGSKAVWAAEFQGGPVNQYLHFGRVPNAEDICRWVLASLAAGTNGISFWNLRAEHFWQETNGFGLLPRIGVSTPRYDEATRIARALSAHAELFAEGTTPTAPVAVLLNERQLNFARGSDGAQASTFLTGSVRGYYRRLTGLGIAVDFVDTTEPGDDLAATLARYSVVVQPAPFALAAEVGRALADYVEAGGTLISDAIPGHVDGDGFATAEGMFEDAEALFGARHASVAVVAEPEGGRRWTPQPRGWGELLEPAVLEGAGALAGTSLRASGLLQLLEPTTGEPILTRSGEVAGVRNRFGSGAAVLLGTLGGLDATSYVNPGSAELFARLLEDAGVAVGEVHDVVVRRREHDDLRADFVVNLGAEPRTVAVGGDGWVVTGDLLGDPVERDGPAARVEVPPVGVRCILLERA